MKNKDVGNDSGNGDLDLFTFGGRPFSGKEFCELFDYNYNTVKRRISRDLNCEWDWQRFYLPDRIGFTLTEEDFRYPKTYKSKCKHFSNRFARVLIRDRFKELREEFNPRTLNSNLKSNLHALTFVINDYKRYYGNPIDERHFKKKIKKYLDSIEEDFNLMSVFYRESLEFVQICRDESEDFDEFGENNLNLFLLANKFAKKAKELNKNKK